MAAGLKTITLAGLIVAGVVGFVLPDLGLTTLHRSRTDPYKLLA